MEKELFFIKDLNIEIKELQIEYNTLTKELKEYPNNCYAQDNWERRYVVMDRLKRIKKLLV